MKIVIPGNPIAKKRRYNREKIPGKKYCYVCGVFKDYGDFHQNRRNKDGLHSECKKCHAANCKKYRTTDAYKKVASASYFRNKEKNTEKLKKYYLENRDKIREKQIRQRNEKVKHFFKSIGGYCRNCGYNKSTIVLQLHHLNEKQKENGSDVLSNWVKWTSMERFIKKVDSINFTILCANCHAELHARLIKNKFKPIRARWDYEDSDSWQSSGKT